MRQTGTGWFEFSLRRYSLLAMMAGACLLFSGIHSFAVEHPGVIPQGADCTSCHANKLAGKSVHSAMVTTCTVCHLAKTQGDMTTVSLAMPKAQICFACHEKSVEQKRHKPAIQADCVDCHDAHRSDERMLLKLASGLPLSGMKDK